MTTQNILGCFLASFTVACISGPTADSEFLPEDPGKADGVGACNVTKTEQDAARELLFDAGLAKRGDEMTISERITVRWNAIKAVRAADSSQACLIVMNLQMDYDAGSGEIFHENGDAWEVVAIGRDRQVELFERVIDVPERLQVAFGSVHPDVRAEDDFYYAELAGAAAYDAYKALTAGIGYSGLSAAISATADGRPDGALLWDPTPGRDWKLADTSFDLSRGLTIEIYDVRPSYLDRDFAGYYRGSSGRVAPWSFGAVRKARPAGATEWTEIVLSDLQPQ